MQGRNRSGLAWAAGRAAPQLRRSEGGDLGRETLKAMWLEHWLQIRKSQSLGRGLGHSTETLVSEAVRTDSFRGFVRFGLVSWEVLFPTIQPLRFYLFSVGATTASHSSDLQPVCKVDVAAS